MKRGFFILTYEPSEDVLTFVSELKKKGKKLNIHPYVVVDNNDYIPPKKYKDFILQIDDNKCIKLGFKNADFIIETKKKKQTTSWSKVWYFLCREFKDLEFSWVVEDDVFIPSYTSVLKMTKKYGNGDYDLVTATNEANPEEKRNYWHWKQMPYYMNNNSKIIAVDSKVDPDRGWHKSMVCALGVSRNLLYIINLQVLAHKQLMFIEFMFNTLASQAGLTIINPPELSTIVYRKDWTEEDFISRPDNWFHPVKDRELHKYLRQD
jgi:hypothetical protein